MVMKRVPTRRASKRQETAVAKAIGGRVQSNSGATPFMKGDVSTDNVLIECKTVMKPQLQVTIKKEWFETNDMEKFAMKKPYSAIVYDFGDKGKQYITMELNEFQNLLKYEDKL